MGEKIFPTPIRGGLVEMTAAKHYARYDYWPADFVQMVKLHCGGRIPARVLSTAAQLKRARFWEVPEHVTNPHPGWTRVHFGPHSFLVPTATLTEGKDYDPHAPTP